MFKGKTLAIDIEENNINIGIGNDKVINFLGNIKNEEENYKDGRVISPEKIGSDIKNYIIENKLKYSDVSFTAYGSDIVLRHMELPILKEKETREAIEYENMQYLPKVEDDYYFDYEILEEIKTKDIQKVKILIFFVPKSKIHDYMKIAKILDAKVKSIDISYNCKTRAISKTIDSKKELTSIGIINIKEERSNFTILENGKLYLYRDTLSGENTIFDNIAIEEDKTRKEVKKEVFEKFSFNPDDNKYHNDEKVLDYFNELFSTFEKILKFYASAGKTTTVDYIYFISQVGNLKGLKEFVKEFFNCEVKIEEITEGINKAIKIPPSQEIIKYLNVIGLLMRRE